MQDNSLIERIWWLIRLRWIAVAGVILVIFFTNKILGIAMPALVLYAIVFMLGVYNLLFILRLKMLRKKSSKDLSLISCKIVNMQISLDLLSLALLIHFSAGIENPFIFYFIFHMIIASILLSRRHSFLQATFATFLFCSIVILEYSGILTHYSLKGFLKHSLYDNPIYVLAASFVFISTLYIAVYMATSISKKLREREESLKQAKELLEEKDRIKSEYVLRVTHDIKEHLSAIQSCIEPVMTGITGPLNDKQFDLLKRARDRTEKLLFFIRALLKITSIKLSKEIRMERFSFGDMLSEAVSVISLKAKDRNISLNYTPEPNVNIIIRGSKEYIQEAITNILANSVKYTPSGGSIDIYVADKNSFVITEIKDTGIGIPREEMPRIFEEFYRASNAKEVERDGTGLGLAISKQIIERHKGSIWVESEQGKGSTFHIILPK